jgi:N-carbamoylputrescine amidase
MPAPRVQELFETPYFCQDQKQELFRLARPFEDNPVLARFAALAKELGVALPISYFERASNAFFNSLAVFDADGSCAGRYRKSHIPDGTGCVSASSCMLPAVMLLLGWVPTA